MRKLISTLAVLATIGSTALQAQELSITSKFGWESEYVFRGVQIAKSNFQPNVDVSFGGAYAGFWAMLPVDSMDTFAKEFNFYGGYSVDLSELVSLDAGATVYYYPSLRDIFPGADETTVEAYVGASLDVILNPSLYVFYDFETEFWTTEASIGHSFPLFEGVSLDLGGHIGYIWVDNSFAMDDYFYGGGSADITYAFTDNVSASVGGRLTFNDLPNPAKDTNAWWGFSLTAGF